MSLCGYSEVCSRVLFFGVLFYFSHYGAALLACHAAGINCALGCCDLAYKACNWGHNVSLQCFPGVHRVFGMQDRMAEVQTALNRAKLPFGVRKKAHPVKLDTYEFNMHKKDYSMLMGLLMCRTAWRRCRQRSTGPSCPLARARRTP